MSLQEQQEIRQGIAFRACRSADDQAGIAAEESEAAECVNAEIMVRRRLVLRRGAVITQVSLLVVPHSARHTT